MSVNQVRNVGFVRGFWGYYEEGKGIGYKRRPKLERDMVLLKYNKYEKEMRKKFPLITLVFGTENKEFLENLGYECQLVSEEPYKWDPNKYMYRHKLECFKQATKHLDEFIFLDWDCFPVQTIPNNFWNVLRSKKKDFQAILRRYNQPKCGWRKRIDNGKRLVPEASWVYIRNKEIPKQMIEIWKDMDKPFLEERVLAKYTDIDSGGWKGREKYWNLYEPEYFVWANTRTASPEVRAKDPLFAHFDRTVIKKKILRRLDDTPEEDREEVVTNRIQKYCKDHSYKIEEN